MIYIIPSTRIFEKKFKRKGIGGKEKVLILKRETYVLTRVFERERKERGILKAQSKDIRTVCILFVFVAFGGAEYDIYTYIKMDETMHDKKYHPVLNHPPLGTGNFGQARLMFETKTGKKVAIKYIPRGKKLDENVVR